MPDWPVRRRPAPETALRDLESRDPKARLAAIDGLVDPPEELLGRAREALERALDDPVSEVRAEAALALAEIGAGTALDKLMVMAEDQDAGVAQAAVIALGESGEPRALSAIVAALESQRADVRFQAVLAAGRLAPDEAFEHLKRAARDSDPEVRANALAALADTAGEEALPVMREAITDDQASVRLEAALALARVGDRMATPVLIEALDDRDVAPQAVRALGSLQDPAALAPLTELCGRWFARPPLRAAASAALAALGDPAGWRELRGWLQSRRREARAMAIYCCGELHLDDSVDDLIDIAYEVQHADRDAAVRALGKIGDPRARSALLNASKAPDADLKADALAALEKLKDES